MPFLSPYNIEPGSVEFNPKKYFKELPNALVGLGQDLGMMLGQSPSVNLPEAPSIRPATPSNLSIEASAPPSMPSGVSASVMPEFTAKQKELDEADREKAKEQIVPPGVSESAKAAKIKDPDMALMQQLISKGINPITDPKKFLQYFDATAEQNGIMRTWGPLDHVREALSPDYQQLKARQAGLLRVGTYFTEKILEQQASRLGAPQTLEEAETAFPGVIRPTPLQLENKVEMPRRGNDVSFVGPMLGVQNADTPLLPHQQDLLVGLQKSLGAGHMIQAPDGSLEPTTLAAQQGRKIDPALVSYIDQAALTPPDQPIPPAPGPMGASSVNKIVEERGKQLASQNAASKQNLNNKLEELAILRSTQKYGKALSYAELSKRDPQLAEEIFQRAEIDIPKEIYSYEQAEQARRQIGTANIIKAEQLRAERQAPVGPDITKYGRMSPDGMNIDKPTDGKMNQETLASEGYVDLSKHKAEIDGINDLSVIQKDLFKLRTYADELFKAGPGLVNILNQGGKLTIAKLGNTGKPTNIVENGRRLTLGELANVYTRQVESMLEYYARNMRGIRGAGTEGDVNRMRSNFAGDFTDQATKNRLFADTEKFLGDVRDGMMSTMFGREAVDRQKQMRSEVLDMIKAGKTDDEIQKHLETKYGKR